MSQNDITTEQIIAVATADLLDALSERQKLDKALYQKLAADHRSIVADMRSGVASALDASMEKSTKRLDEQAAAISKNLHSLTRIAHRRWWQNWFSVLSVSIAAGLACGWFFSQYQVQQYETKNAAAIQLGTVLYQTYPNMSKTARKAVDPVFHAVNVPPPAVK